MPKTILAQQEHPLTADTKLVVSHGTWRKKDYVDVRTHWRSPAGEWFPTKKGVRLGVDLAITLESDLARMLGITRPPKNGNGESAPSVDTSTERIQHDIYGDLDAPAHEKRDPAPDLSVLAFLKCATEHIHAGEVLEGPSWGRAVRDFSLRMAQHFQRPDAPHTAIFSPLMRPKIEAEIGRIRSTKKPRRASQRPQDGVFCWSAYGVAKSQHPDHPRGQGASYCETCHPHTIGRARVIPDRAQRCVDSGISRDPLPKEAFAWRRDLDAQSAKQAQEWRSKQAA